MWLCGNEIIHLNKGTGDRERCIGFVRFERFVVAVTPEEGEEPTETKASHALVVQGTNQTTLALAGGGARHC